MIYFIIVLQTYSIIDNQREVAWMYYDWEIREATCGPEIELSLP